MEATELLGSGIQVPRELVRLGRVGQFQISYESTQRIRL